MIHASNQYFTITSLRERPAKAKKHEGINSELRAMTLDTKARLLSARKANLAVLRHRSFSVITCGTEWIQISSLKAISFCSFTPVAVNSLLTNLDSFRKQFIFVYSRFLLLLSYTLVQKGSGTAIYNLLQ